MILAELTLDAALAATATLVATGVRGGRARALAGPPAPPRAGLDDLAAHVRRRLAALWLAEAGGWSGPTFRVFYLFGAILNVPWLALGTVYLLAGRRLADGVAVGPRHRVGLRGRGDGEPHRCTAPVPADELPEGHDLFGPSPASWPPSGRAWPPSSSSAARCGRRGGCGAAVARAGSRRPTSRRRASRSATSSSPSAPSSCRPAARSPGGWARTRRSRSTLVTGVVILFAGFLVATPGA